MFNFVCINSCFVLFLDIMQRSNKQKNTQGDIENWGYLAAVNTTKPMRHRPPFFHYFFIVLNTFSYTFCIACHKF